MFWIHLIHVGIEIFDEAVRATLSRAR